MTLAPDPTPSPEAEARGWLAPLRELVTHNVGFKVLSLLTALFIWGLVQEEEDVEENAQVFLNIKVPDNLVLLARPQAYATVRLIGPRKLLKSAEERRLEIHIDLSAAGPGDHSINLTERFIRNIPQDITVADINPPLLRVSLDRKTSRRVKIEVKTTGVLPPGLSLVSARASPAELVLEGAAGDLKELKALPTQPLDLSQIEEDGKVKVPLDFSSGKALWTMEKEDSVEVEVKLKEDVATRTVEARVELEGGGALKVEPSRVELTLKGPGRALAGLDTGEIQVVIDAAGRPAGRAAEVRWSGADGWSSPDGLTVRTVLPEVAGLTVTAVSPGVLLVRGADVEAARTPRKGARPPTQRRPAE